MRYLLALGLLLLLGSGCSKSAPWQGFYYLEDNVSIRYVSQPLDTLVACKQWAKDVAENKPDTSGKDHFECARDCIRLKTGQYQCDNNGEFKGSFEAE